MRLLLDSCVWGKARQELETAGHDVIWAGNWPHDPGDDEILARAHQENRILVTLDKDFGELAIVRGRLHCGILRLVNTSARQQATVCVRVLAEHGDELGPGAIITAEPGRSGIKRARLEEQSATDHGFIAQPTAKPIPMRLSGDSVHKLCA